MAGRRSRSPLAAMLCLAVLLVVTAPPAGAVWQLQAQDSSAEAPFPSCSWWQQFSVSTANMAFPDTNAAYWIMPYRVGKDTELVIKGPFPEARYFSIQLYDAKLSDFTFESCQFNVTPGLADYQLYAQPGGLNPFRATNAGACSAAQEARTSGNFSIWLTNDLPVPQANTLPVGRNTQDTEQGFYYIVLRIYKPTETNTSAIVLPTVDLIEGGKTFTLPQCLPGEKQLPMPPSSGSNSSDSSSDSKEDVPRSVWLREPVGGVFPNKETGYLSAYLPADSLPEQLFIISLLPPSAPSGARPVVWPDAQYQARYWSICNNVNNAEQPVIINDVNGTRIAGCLANDQAVPDEGGNGTTVTIVVSTPENRPATAQNWLPTSLEYPDVEEILLYRNMLCSAGFKECVTQVPDNSSPEDAEAAMGPYYPRSVWCDPDVFAKGASAAEGARLCFEAAGGGSS